MASKSDKGKKSTGKPHVGSKPAKKESSKPKKMNCWRCNSFCCPVLFRACLYLSDFSTKSSRQRPFAQTHCHHYGWERALGTATEFGTGRRTQAWSAGGSRNGRHLPRAWYLLPDSLCVLNGELATTSDRGSCADGAVAALPPIRAPANVEKKHSIAGGRRFVPLAPNGTKLT